MVSGKLNIYKLLDSIPNHILYRGPIVIYDPDDPLKSMYDVDDGEPMSYGIHNPQLMGDSQLAP
jgi:hypothetical protein